MKVKDLIKQLKSCDQNFDVVFYHKKENDLEQASVESILNIDDINTVEITTEITEEVA